MRIALALAAAAALPLAARAAPGAVDWQRKVVTCTGSGAANLRDAAGNPAVARIGAEKAAKLDALRSCLETLKGVQLKTGETVGGALASDAALSGQVEGLVRGFRVVGKPRYYSDGGVEVDVEVPLDGALSNALLPRPDAATPPSPAPDAPKPDPARPAAPAAPPGSGGPKPEAAAAPTSLVVDARGQKIVPALAPRILDASGKELYGAASLGDAGRRAGGTAAYARDLDAARATLKDRMGDRPLVVRPVAVKGSDVVVSAADAAILSGKDLAFLADARVVILAD